MARSQPGRLDGKVAWVTGSTKGIGLAVGTLLLERGADVVFSGRGRQAPADVPCQPSASYVAVDVADPDQVAGAVELIEGRCGGVDVLVNNAGIPAVAPSDELPLAQWRRCLEVNLTGAFLCSAAVAPRMRDRGGGAIVMVSSVAGEAGLPRRAAYSAAKAGLLGLVRALAVEWAPDRIRVNAVAPAFIETSMTRFIKDGGGSGDWSLDAIEGRTPLGRMGHADEVANAVAFLASPEASYVTGATLRVDGGWLAFGGWTRASGGKP